MHVVLTGATGLVGSGILNQMLKSTTISKISILSRRPVPVTEGHSKANVIIHKDFNTYDEGLLGQLKGAEGCVFALGISVNAVSKEEYRKITIDYPLAAAKAFASLASPFKFVYISGEGTTTTPGMLTPHFARIKGEAESSLLSLSNAEPSLKVYSVRPGGVDPKSDTEIHAYLPEYKGIMKAAEKLVMPAFRTFHTAMVSPTDAIGRVCIDLATGDGAEIEGKGVSGEGRTLSNVALRRLASL